MLVPSKKIFYAIEAVLYIAYNTKAGPVSGGDIAAAQALPTRYLEPMMQKLVRVGILKGVRGPQGGYILGRERRRISLADICDTLAEDADLPTGATAFGDKILRPTATELMARWREQLGTVTIATLCERATEQRIPTAHETANDFTI
ncbi:MAG: Rrf2 family transcriptional regulator [Pseudomonadota bacterium]